jgi:hypothetical protein
MGHKNKKRQQYNYRVAMFSVFNRKKFNFIYRQRKKCTNLFDHRDAQSYYCLVFAFCGLWEQNSELSLYGSFCMMVLVVMRYDKCGQFRCDIWLTQLGTNNVTSRMMIMTINTSVTTITILTLTWMTMIGRCH